MKTNENTTVPVGTMKALGFKLAGVDPDVMKNCPKRDQDNALTIAAIMILVWGWQTAAFSATAHAVTNSLGTFRPELLAGAMLIATLIAALDSYMIMRPSWFLHGQSELARVGYGAKISTGDRVKAGSFFAVRIAISINIAALTGLITLMQLFASDVKDNDALWLQQQNAPIIAAATERVDATIKIAMDDRERLSKAIAQLAVHESQLQQVLVGNSSSDPELPDLIARSGQVAKEKAGAEAALETANARYSNEVGGASTPETSGRVGDGPLARAAFARVRNARELVTAKTNELTALQTRIDQLRRSSTAGQQARLSDARTRLPVLLAEKTELEAKLKENDALRQTLLAERDQKINEAVANHQLRMTSSMGFLAQVRALWRLSSDPVIAGIITMVALFFFTVELAAVLAKLTTIMPSTYAKRVARDEDYRAYEELDGLTRDVERLHAQAADSHGGGAAVSDQGSNPAADPDIPDSRDGSSIGSPHSVVEAAPEIAPAAKADDAVVEARGTPPPSDIEQDAASEAPAPQQNSMASPPADMAESPTHVPEQDKPGEASPEVPVKSASGEDETMNAQEKEAKRAMKSDIERRILERLAKRAESSPPAEGAPPDKKGRGRPKGSPNKPKGVWLPKNRPAK